MPPTIEGNPGPDVVARSRSIFIHQDPHEWRHLERVEGPPARLRAYLHLVEKEIPVVRREQRRNPAVGELAGEAKTRRGERRQEDRDVGTQRPHLHLQALGQVEDLALEPERLTSQDGPHDLDGLAHPLHRLLEGHAVPAADDLVPAGAETKDESPVRDEVQRCRRLRDQGRGSG